MKGSQIRINGDVYEIGDHHRGNLWMATRVETGEAVVVDAGGQLFSLSDEPVPTDPS